MAGTQYRGTDAFVDEIPAACKDIDLGHGGCRRPGRGAEYVAAGWVNVKGD